MRQNVLSSAAVDAVIPGNPKGAGFDGYFHRVTVVLNGNSLTIEGRDGGAKDVKVTPGQVDWDEPSDRPHRGVNSGTTLYEEVTIFFLDRPGALHQPPA